MMKLEKSFRTKNGTQLNVYNVNVWQLKYNIDNDGKTLLVNTNGSSGIM